MVSNYENEIIVKDVNSRKKVSTKMQKYINRIIFKYHWLQIIDVCQGFSFKEGNNSIELKIRDYLREWG